MPISEWSDRILIVELSDEPLFSEDMDALSQRLDHPAASQAAGTRPGRAPAGHPAPAAGTTPDIILNMKSVTFLNSSNIAQLLRLRKKVIAGQKRLRICAVADPVWSVLLITGLDKVFEFTSDVSTALASLQIGGTPEG
jgi:hypothetical protein